MLIDMYCISYIEAIHEDEEWADRILQYLGRNEDAVVYNETESDILVQRLGTLLAGDRQDEKEYLEEIAKSRAEEDDPVVRQSIHYDKALEEAVEEARNESIRQSKTSGRTALEMLKVLACRPLVRVLTHMVEYGAHFRGYNAKFFDPKYAATHLLGVSGGVSFLVFD